MALTDLPHIEPIQANDQIQLTLAAANAIKDLLQKKSLENAALRIFVKGGGCSGFQYGMALETNIRENDFVFENHAVEIVVDEISFNYLRGATIDFVEDIMGSGFKVENPNAISTCGCGSSFRTNKASGSPTTANPNSCSSCG